MAWNSPASNKPITNPEALPGGVPALLFPLRDAVAVRRHDALGSSRRQTGVQPQGLLFSISLRGNETSVGPWSRCGRKALLRPIAESRPSFCGCATPFAGRVPLYSLDFATWVGNMALCIERWCIIRSVPVPQCRKLYEQRAPLSCPLSHLKRSQIGFKRVKHQSITRSTDQQSSDPGVAARGWHLVYPAVLISSPPISGRGSPTCLLLSFFPLFWRALRQPRPLR